MSSRVLFFALALASAAATPSVASAQEFFKRCEIDNLDPSSATERVHWYLARYPAEIRDKAISVTSRTDVTQAQANAWYLNNHLNDAIFGGPAERPLYPSFLLSDLSNPQNYFAPVDRNAGANKPANYLWMGSCLSSCYKPGVEVLFAVEEGSNGPQFENVAIDVASQSNLKRVAVLDDSSSLEDPKLEAADVAYYTESLSEVDHDILDFTMRSGATLQITPNHPVVDDTGAIREARTFAVGEHLVRADGTLDPIASITKEKFFGRVYNVAPKTPSLIGQVVVANGFLNGSIWYQNDGQRYMNRALFRDAIPLDVVR